MNILVTGSRGVVGTALVDELRQKGHAVHGCDLTHGPEGHSWSFADPESECAEYSRCDISEYRELARLLWAMPEVDVVYHCAAEFGRANGEDYYESLWRTNVIGTKHLLRLQEEFSFKLVFFSSSEVYGNWLGEMTEDVPRRESIHLLNDYAISKWASEMQLANAAGNHGAQNVIVRLFNTYGPGEYYTPYRSVNCRMLYAALHGHSWDVHPGFLRTFTFLPDAVRAMANIAERFYPDAVYNIGGTEEHSMEKLSDVVLRVTGADPGLARLVDPPLVTTKQKRVNVSGAQKDLDLKAHYTLEEGMEKTAQWMRRIYDIPLR
ncbi:hypothetical protein LCGC14_1163800 [marine sediment metagenome]|uniref:NAD-dependent epimerase/dehydratase domain-containing protein n=1 Tax=marine sediment metagenome TaxID=412755 RepID=A0A0F9MEY7_9ZZZZ